MKIAVIGSHGQLGSDLVRTLGAEGLGLTHADIEITDPRSIAEVLDSFSPGVVVNTAAYNLVDQAENDPQTAFAINAFGPLHLARYCAAGDLTLVHISTDYVYGRSSDHTRPYTERDLPEPISVYGTSKLAGEYFVRSICPKHFVIRSCGLYGSPISPGKGNFVRTMLRLTKDRNELTVVDDQRCTPTSTSDLAAAILALIPTGEYGLYHITNSGSATWCEFARAIFELSSMDISVSPINSEQFGALARRPAYSVLDCSRYTEVTGKALPHWRVALEAYLRESDAQA